VKKPTALVLANDNFLSIHGKTAHGLVRGSDRFAVVGVIEPALAGRDAGEALDGKRSGIPIFASIADAVAGLPAVPDYCVIGVASHGGALPPSLRALLAEALAAGMSVVNGLHEYADDDPTLSALARRKGLEIIDVRRPKPKSELHFWTGAIAGVRAPRIACLGMDCAIGKRTTCRLLMGALNAHGIAAEMIYTGQTGWMQGAPYGFVLDAVYNDFVTGELEHAVVMCDRERSPRVILLEGQSALRNPCGPCGAELLLSARAHGVILQHAPGRRYFEGYEEQEILIPPVADEIKLIAMYGARTLAVTLNGSETTAEGLRRSKEVLAAELGIPVIDPLTEVDRLVPVVQAYIEAETRP
jgi:uncharacterized NAD-dependent epimerase/dehydratase family protein